MNAEVQKRTVQNTKSYNATVKMNYMQNNGNGYTYKTQLPLTCTACKIDVNITFMYFQMLVHYFHIRCNMVKMPHQGKNEQFFVLLETQCY